MPTPVELPQLGNTVEECLISRWRKSPGDAVTAGDVVADIETDKTTFEITAPESGTLLATFFDEGALVPVLTTIFVIGKPGESVDAFRPHGAAAGAAAAALAIDAPAHTSAVRTASVDRVGGAVPLAAYSPRASRFAATHQFYPASIAGTGPGGRVLERDVRRAYESFRLKAEARPDVSAMPDVSADQPLTGLRATIARRMRESLAATAQYTLHASADASGLLAARRRFKARAAAGTPDVTIGDLVMFCTIEALREVPDLNVAFVDGHLVRHDPVHLAFAADTPRGLLAPVIRHAQSLTIEALATRARQLSAQAVEGSIAADDLTGGTFTVSNLGAFGIESFTPLLNPPQVAILGIGAIQPRVVRKQGTREPLRVRETSARRAMALIESLEFIDAIGLSLTCDHQVIDGAPAARFLQTLRVKIENVESIVGDESL